MKASEWNSRGLGAANPIDALSDFWRAFNNLYFPTLGRNERFKIAAFLKTNIDKIQAAKLIEKHLEKIEYFVCQPIVDMRGNGHDTSRDIETYRHATEPVAKLTSLFMMIYQVRCNLEHGQKSPTRERDIELCRCAAAIVSDVNIELVRETP